MLTRLADRARWWTWAGLATAGLGLTVALLTAWVEYLAHPGTSLADAYRAGRTPWMPMGVAISLAGASLALLSGTLATLAARNLARRILVLPLVGLAAWWWASVLAPGTPVVVPDGWLAGPLRIAFEQPVGAALLLLGPALAGAVLALAGEPPAPPPPPRLKPVEPPPPSPYRDASP